MTHLRIGRLDVMMAAGHVAFAGRIDDSAALGEVAAQLAASGGAASGGNVVVDTDGVTFVNSIGMRELIRFVRALRERGTAVTLDRVADVLITQINMIPELAKNVAVTSFHAQYVCSACGAEAAPLVDAVANAAALRQLQAPRLPCPECGAAMELADFPERYLTIFRT